MQPLTVEYIAGFVDGEGSFSIYESHARWYSPYFSITSTNTEIIRDIRKYFCLNVKIATKEPKKPEHKAAHELKTTNIDDCKSIAGQLLPFLRIKQKQAELITQFPRAQPTYIGRGSEPDLSTKALQQKLRKAILALNKTGPAAQESNEDPQLEPDPQLSLFQHKGRS